jgi:hypothetical protein
MKRITMKQIRRFYDISWFKLLLTWLLFRERYREYQVETKEMLAALEEEGKVSPLGNIVFLENARHRSGGH